MWPVLVLEEGAAAAALFLYSAVSGFPLDHLSHFVLQEGPEISAILLRAAFALASHLRLELVARIQVPMKVLLGSALPVEHEGLLHEGQVCWRESWWGCRLPYYKIVDVAV